MKKNINYYEGEEGEKEKIELCATELSDLIEERINMPGKKSKETIKSINSLIDEFNVKYGKKVYKRLSFL